MEILIRLAIYSYALLVVYGVVVLLHGELTHRNLGCDAVLGEASPTTKPDPESKRKPEPVGPTQPILELGESAISASYADGN